MLSFSRCKLFALFILVLLVIGTRLVAHAEPTEYIINNGPSSNRVDIVVMGDGYTAAEMQKYRDDVQRFMQGFFGQDPFREYQSYFNVIRIDVVSNQSGADHPENGTFVDTALDAAYNCVNIQRAICIDGDKGFGVLNRSVTPIQSDIKVVIVNDPMYGGSATSFAVSSVHYWAVETLLHEVAHSFGFLADEYEYGGTNCNYTYEPNIPNVTIATTRETIKWNYWIDPSTPIPTVGAPSFVPGLFEGALYCPHGIYRPTNTSKMRSVGAPFEQINTEQLILRMYDTVSLIDAGSPSTSSITLYRGETQTFSITKQVPFTHSLIVRWFVDGQWVGNEDTFLIDSMVLNSGTHTVDVLVQDSTPAVRRDPNQLTSDTKRWTVTIDATPTPTPTPTPTSSPPVIITEANSNRAIALDSVLFIRDQFPTTAPMQFGVDQRTRIVIFARNAQVSAGEVVLAQLEVGAQVVPLEIEYVGPLSGTPDITMVVIKLPAGVTTQVDAQVSITLRGLTSNKAVLSVRPP